MKIFSRALFFLIMAFLILPVLTMLIWSFFANWYSDSLLPSNLTLDGFRYFFASGDYMVAIKSLIFSTIIGIISVILSIMLSRFLILSSSRHKLKMESFFYFPMLLPVVSISIGSHKMFLGFSGSFSGIIIAILHIYFSLPYAFKIVYSCYQAWGMEYEQIGRELGASESMAFFRINLPLYLKGYLASFIMAFVVSYSQYFINYFIGDPRFVNFSMIMTAYVTNSNRNISSVYTFMYIILGIIVMIISSYIEKTENIKEAWYELFSFKKYKLQCGEE